MKNDNSHSAKFLELSDQQKEEISDKLAEKSITLAHISITSISIHQSNDGYIENKGLINPNLCKGLIHPNLCNHTTIHNFHQSQDQILQRIEIPSLNMTYQYHFNHQNLSVSDQKWK